MALQIAISAFGFLFFCQGCFLFLIFCSTDSMLSLASKTWLIATTNKQLLPLNWAPFDEAFRSCSGHCGQDFSNDHVVAYSSDTACRQSLRGWTGPSKRSHCVAEAFPRRPDICFHPIQLDCSGSAAGLASKGKQLPSNKHRVVLLYVRETLR